MLVGPNQRWIDEGGYEISRSIKTVNFMIIVRRHKQYSFKIPVDAYAGIYTCVWKHIHKDAIEVIAQNAIRACPLHHLK